MHAMALMNRSKTNCPSVIRKDRIRKIHAECFPISSNKIAGSRNMSTKTAKSRQTKVSPVVRLQGG
jgi:hypothetical protein